MAATYQMNLDIDEKRDNIVAMLGFIKQDIARSKRLYREAVNEDGLMPMECIRVLRGYTRVLGNEHLINAMKKDDLLKEDYKETLESLCELKEAMDLNENNMCPGFYCTQEMMDRAERVLKKYPVDFGDYDSSQPVISPKLAAEVENMMREIREREVADRSNRLMELVNDF